MFIYIIIAVWTAGLQKEHKMSDPSVEDGVDGDAGKLSTGHEKIIGIATLVLLVVLVALAFRYADQNGGLTATMGALKPVVALFCAIVASALVSGSMKFKLDLGGKVVTATGGFAVFAVVMFDDGQPMPPPPSLDNFTESYSRLFGAMEVPTLLKILKADDGTAPGTGKLQKLRALVKKGEHTDPTSDAVLEVTGLYKRCPHIDSTDPEYEERAVENYFDSDCSFKASHDLLISFALKWPYERVRVAKTPLLDQINQSHSLPVDMLFAANSDTQKEIRCLIESLRDHGVDVLGEPAQRDEPIENLVGECDPMPSRKVGFLMLTIRNKSDSTFDKVAVRLATFGVPDGMISPVNFQPYDVVRGEGINALLKTTKTVTERVGENALLDYEQSIKPDIEKKRGYKITETSFRDVRPGEVLLVLVGAYKARAEDSFEAFYLTDVTFPVSVHYDVGGHQVVENIDLPSRDKGSVMEFDGGWGWSFQ